MRRDGIAIREPNPPQDVRGGYVDALAALRAAMRADVGDGRG
ncbi:hypothetical protein [Streptomyces sp. 1222.5]